MRRLLAALALLCLGSVLAAQSLVAAPAAPGGLLRAELEVPRGVDPKLRQGASGEPVRVAFLLRSQPVLAASRRAAFRRRLAMRPARVRAAARRHPRRITALEKRTARRAERRRGAAMRSLGPPVWRQARSQAPLARAIRHTGGKVLGAELLPNRLIARLQRSDALRLAKRADIQVLRADQKPRPALDTAAQSVGAPTWWNAGHTGGTGSADTVPADLADATETPDPTHPAFADVTLDIAPHGIEPDAHGTAVAGVLASGDTQYRGIAYGVDRLIAGFHLSDNYALGVPDPVCGGCTAADPAEVMNISFGTSSFDFPDLVPPFFNVSVAMSAGNDGPGPSSVDAGRFNRLVVGGFDDHDTASLVDDNVVGSSARGPTTDGRKQPDLVAPYALLTADWTWDVAPCNSLNVGEQPDPDLSCPDYRGAGGTSFSAPFVSGGLALLAGSGISDAKAQRAILVNSARPISNESQSGWDPDSGWGALNLTRALAERANYRVGSVEEGEASLFRANAPADTKATLIWDRRGIPSLDPFNCCGIAFTTTNLDLHQERADGSEVMPPPDPGYGAGPDALDPNDTVEQVRSPSGEGTQEVLYKVKAASTIEGAGAEPFAIAAGAPLQKIAEPDLEPVELAKAGPEPAACGDQLIVTGRATNPSADLDAEDAEISIALPSGVDLVSGEQAQELSGGTLEKQATSEVHSWTVELTEPGPRALQITSSGAALGETWTETRTISVGCSPPASADPTELSAPSPPACGQPTTVSARLHNPSGALTAEDANATLAVPAGVELLSAATLAGGDIAPGATTEPLTWSVRPNSPGPHQLTLGTEALTHAGTSHPHSAARQATLSLSCEAPPQGGGPDPGPGPGAGKPSKSLRAAIQRCKRRLKGSAERKCIKRARLKASVTDSRPRALFR